MLVIDVIAIIAIIVCVYILLMRLIVAYLI